MERMRKGKNWYTKCDCGNWKAEKAKQCLECVQAKRRAKFVCPDCNGPKKSATSQRCHTCAGKAKRKPEIWTCPKCRSLKDSKASQCWDCYQSETFDGPTHCSECGSQLTNPWMNTTGLCLDCYQAGRAREPTLCLDCGIEITHCSKRCKPCADSYMTGENHPLYGKSLPPDHLKNLRAALNTPEHRQRSADRMKRMMEQGKIEPWPKPYIYNHRKYRSGWEARVAHWLDVLKVPFEYETHYIPVNDDVGVTLYYIPDFYIPKGDYSWPDYFQDELPSNGDFFIEVKGRFREEAKAKMRLVKQQHPSLVIVMFRHRKMHMIPKLLDGCATRQLSLF